MFMTANNSEMSKQRGPVMEELTNEFCKRSFLQDFLFLRPELVSTNRELADLLAILDNILKALQLPPLALQPELPILLPEATVTPDETKTMVLVLNAENRPEWELLEEHLGKRDPMWAALEKWKKAMLAHLQARMALRSETESLLKSKTGYRLVEEATAPPFLYSDTVVPLLYREALNIAFETASETSLEKRIKVDKGSGEVRYDAGTILAKAPGAEEKCESNIVAAFGELTESAGLKRTVESYHEIEKPMAALKRAAEEIDLMGIVPGRCRICRRIGI